MKNRVESNEECLKQKFHPLHWKDLMTSGLYGEIIRKAGIYTLPPNEIPKLLGWNPLRVESAYIIPYPGKDGFFRLKVFPSYVDEKGKRVKYLQCKDSGVHFYIPPGVEKVLNDPTIPLIIPEGEKKALKAYQEGFFCISLGGVTCWSQNRQAINDFNMIQWKGREVYIVFDSDAVPNLDVLREEFKLSQELKSRGAVVKVVKLPSKNGEKVGLDDFLIAHGPEALKKLIEEAKEPESPEILSEDISWPDPPDKAVFYGLAGELVEAIEPHTEADPVALLVQFLVAFGNVIGGGAHFIVEADKHSLNLFAILVGISSRGRKGSAWGHVRRLLKNVDEEWAKDNIKSGLSSGEGLIWVVRDLITQKIAKNGEIIEEVRDFGVSDKRLLVLETEFAAPLRVQGREGNILSTTLRQAWDSGNLRTLVKNSPAQASDAHISVIGHITKEELLKYLNTTEAASGFGNRFMWVCVKRSKCLPEGGKIHEVNFDQMIKQLSQAITFARQVEEMKRDEKATAIWREVYPELTSGDPGLLGAVISRAEAQVMRLACIYALLDQSSVIKADHLKAALALWEYCEASARFIFGDSTGDPVADEILSALRNAFPEGLNRTKIQNLFDRNIKAERISHALTTLLEYGLARKTTKKSNGRPSEWWFAISRIRKKRF